MKILMISETGDGFGIAEKLSAEGNEVRVWVKDRRYRDTMLGIINFVDSWRPSASGWADLIVADMVGFGQMAKTLDGFNVPHIGFNLVGDLLELDREKQMETFRNVGITIPVTYSFSSPGEAEEMLMSLWSQATKGWAIKPSGNLATGKTFVVRDKETLEWVLQQYASDQKLIAQKLVEGVEISTEGWFNGKEWLEPFNHTMEEKRLMDGGLGPNTGCMGNVVWAISDPGNDAFVQNLRRLTPMLKAINYKGPIDLNTIANKQGIFALELTTRFGYDAIEGLYSLMSEPLGKTLSSLALGGKTTMTINPGFAAVVRVTVPPFPHADPEDSDVGLPIHGVPFKPIPPNYFLTDIYVDGDVLRWAGSDGVLMKVAGTGRTVDAALDVVYKAVERIKVNNIQYRKDIGSRVMSDLERLKNWGHINSPGLFETVKKAIGG